MTAFDYEKIIEDLSVTNFLSSILALTLGTTLTFFASCMMLQRDRERSFYESLRSLANKFGLRYMTYDRFRRTLMERILRQRRHNENISRTIHQTREIRVVVKQPDVDADLELKRLQQACDCGLPEKVYEKIEELYLLKIPLPFYVLVDCLEMVGRTCCFSEVVKLLTDLCAKEVAICPHFYISLFNSSYVRTRTFTDVLMLVHVMFDHGIDMSEHTLNTLLDICAEDRTASVVQGYQLFHEYEIRYGPVQQDMAFNILMKCCARKGDLYQAWQVFSLIKVRKVALTDIFFTSLIDCLAESANGQVSTAWRLIEEMGLNGIHPNVRTINAYCKVCSRRGYLPNTESIFQKMKDLKITPDQLTFNTLIDTHANSRIGTIMGATRLLQKMRNINVQPDVRTYTSLMKVCSRRREYSECARVFYEMLENGTKPNVVSFNTLIDCLGWCRSSRVYQKAKHLLNLMDAPQHTVEANCTTYTCLMKVLMRRQLTREAVEIYTIMVNRGVRPNAWTVTTMGFQKRRSSVWDYYSGPPIQCEGNTYYGPRHRRKREPKMIDILEKIELLEYKIATDRERKRLALERLLGGTTENSLRATIKPSFVLELSPREIEEPEVQIDEAREPTPREVAEEESPMPTHETQENLYMDADEVPRAEPTAHVCGSA